MPIVDEDIPCHEIVPRLRTLVQSGLFAQKDGLILPETFSTADKVILLELTRKIAIENAVDCSALQGYSDFAEWVYPRRPDPTRDQWLWLLQNISQKHGTLSVDEACGIMAGRDALLPFMTFAPNPHLQMCYEKFFEKQAEDDGSSSLPYPNLEEAIINDAPAKVNIYRLMCRNITDEQILNRAICLQKQAVVISLLKKLPSDMKVHKLIKVLCGWTTPEILLNQAIQEFSNDLNSWEDKYGNSFFWYLYSLPNLVSKNMVDLLPEELLCVFDQPNCYGISPEDLWLYYRKGMQSPEQ